MPPLAIGLAVGVGGAIAGRALSAGDRQAALDSNKESVQQWLDLNVPDPATQKAYLKQYVNTGKLEPKLETAFKQAQSEMSKVSVDSGARGARLRALGTLQDIGNQGGLNITDQANLQKTLADNASSDRGRREAITNNMAARGVGGGGLELAAKLQGAQDASQRDAQASLQTAGSARDRALQSILQAGQLGGQLENDDFSEKSAQAKAQDAINEFNTRNLQGVEGRNVDRYNDANKYNVTNAQNISNGNTDIANKEQMYNTSLIQQNYDNQVKKAAGASGQYDKVADAYTNNANSTANMWGGIGSAAVGAGAAAYGYDKDQQRKKAGY